MSKKEGKEMMDEIRRVEEKDDVKKMVEGVSSILSSDVYNRILATLKAHKVQEGQIDYCFENIEVKE